MSDRAPRDRDRTQRAARTALSRLIEDSGLGVTAFAGRVVGVDPRSARRWLDSRMPIPDVRVRWLLSIRAVECAGDEITIRFHKG